VQGRKAIVVFSNGPDNVSMVAPNDVERVAVDEGVPVYVVATLDPKESLLAHTLKRLTERTGGKLYLTQNWQAQTRAFQCIHDEISSSYTAYYYPAFNPNDGFRNIRVEVITRSGKVYRVRARPGYRPGSRSVSENK
jgi:hypothetical protein